jgi:hypothetical protein
MLAFAECDGFTELLDDHQHSNEEAWEQWCMVPVQFSKAEISTLLHLPSLRFHYVGGCMLGLYSGLW